MRNRTDAPPGVTVRLTDDERKRLSEKVREANKRSEQGRGGGSR